MCLNQIVRVQGFAVFEPNGEVQGFAVFEPNREGTEYTNVVVVSWEKFVCKLRSRAIVTSHR